MISSRRLIHVSFVLIVLLAIDFASIDARRFSSGRSRSSGGSRHSTGRVSAPRTPVYIPKTPVYVPKPSSHVPHRQPTSSGSSFPQPHTPHNSGSSSGKDSSNGLIHAEGGGRPRPSSIPHDQKPQNAPHQPSAPYDPVHKVTTGHVQSQAPPNGSPNPSGSYPPWANPSANPHGSIPSAPHIPAQPHGTGFPSSPYNPSQSIPAKPGTGPLTSAPYPPTHPAGPISHTNVMSAPYPNTYPHPNSPHGAPPPYSPPSAPYPNAHPQGMPMPSAPHIGFGNNGAHHPVGAPQHYPSVGSTPMQSHGGYAPPTVIHNHYNAPPVGSPQNPAGHPVYGHQPVYGGGPVPMGQPFVPGQTVVVLPNQQSHDSGRGLGQLFKEALVYSTVNAGVNRIINGAPHHHHDTYSSSSQPVASAGIPTTSSVTNTVIYNNQYGTPTSGSNGMPAQGQTGPAIPPGNPMGASVPNVPGGNPVPNSPAGSSSPNLPNPGASPNFPNPGASPNPGVQNPSQTGTPTNPQSPEKPPTQSGAPSIAQPNSGNNTNQTAADPVPEFVYFIPTEELWNVTEELFAKDEIKATQYVQLKLQKRSLNPNVTDKAPERLLHVRDEAYALPTIRAIRDMYDNYEYDSERKEVMNSDKWRQENVFLDTFLSTNIMTTAMNWLSKKGYIESDDFEWKDTLRHIWLSKVNGATSGFERVFLAEKYPGPTIIGAQNWIYFDSQEWLRRIDYMSYVDKINLGDKATLLKINFKMDDVLKPNTTMLVGTPPELEMALYTICYYARPNDFCSVSLNGTKLNIYTHSFRYFGKDVMDLGLMFF